MYTLNNAKIENIYDGNGAYLAYDGNGAYLENKNQQAMLLFIG